MFELLQKKILNPYLYRTLTSISVGSRVSKCRTVTAHDVQTFADLTGDFNCVHFSTPEKSIVHGVLLNGFVSSVLGTQLPGSGYVVIEQTMIFPNPCYIGQEIQIEVEVAEARKVVVCNFVCTVEKEKKIVHKGTAKLIKLKK